MPILVWNEHHDLMENYSNLAVIFLGLVDALET